MIAKQRAFNLEANPWGITRDQIRAYLVAKKSYITIKGYVPKLLAGESADKSQARYKLLNEDPKHKKLIAKSRWKFSQRNLRNQIANFKVLRAANGLVVIDQLTTLGPNVNNNLQPWKTA